MSASLSGAGRAGLLSAAGMCATVALASAALVDAGLSPWPGLDLRLGLVALLWFVTTAVVTALSFSPKRTPSGYLRTPRSQLGTALLAASACLLLGEAVVAAAGALQVTVAGLLGALGLELGPADGILLAARIGAALLALLLGLVGLVAVPGAAPASAVIGAIAVLAILAGALGGGEPVVAVEASPLVDRVLVHGALIPFWIVVAMAPALVPPRRRALAVSAVAYGATAAFALVALPALRGSTPAGLQLAAAAGLLLAAGLALQHRLIAGYGMVASLVRSGLAPRGLVERSAQLGTPYRVVLLLVLSIAFATSLMGPRISFIAAVALGAAGVLFFAIGAAVRAAREQRYLIVLCALMSALGALALLFAALLRDPLTAASALGVGLAVSVAAMVWRGLRGQLPHLRAETAEREAADSPSGAPILTLREALEVVPRYRPRVLLATTEGSDAIIDRGVLRADDDETVFVLYVDELPGRFYPPHISASAAAMEVLLDTCSKLDGRGLQGIPIWRVAHDAAASIAQAARSLGVSRVIVDVPERAPLHEVFRGQTLGRLRKLLDGLSLEVVRPGVQEDWRVD